MCENKIIGIKMISEEIEKKYKARAEANYKAKLPIYLFHCCIKQKTPVYDEFIKYKLDDTIIEKYATEYMQAREEEEIGGVLRDEIYYFIKENKENDSFKYNNKEYIIHFQEVLSINDFEQLISKEECSYCGISLKQIENLGYEGKLYNKRAYTRGYSLEIDRMNPNKEYTLDNICMSCYWCNNAKTDEFTVEEFEGIARGINRIWQKRLGTEIVVFPETFYRKTKGDKK